MSMTLKSIEIETVILDSKIILNHFISLYLFNMFDSIILHCVSGGE